MNITQQTENTICIELTQDDMTRLDITYDELDYSNIETRRVLWTLLDEAKHKLGKNISLTQKMLIEAMPDKCGGCKLYFTVTNAACGKKQIVKTDENALLCESDNLNNLCLLASSLNKLGCIQKSELYSDSGNYRLFLQPKQDFGGDLSSIASEFCTICSLNAKFFTFEHYKLLASPDAVEILNSLI